MSLHKTVLLFKNIIKWSLILGGSIVALIMIINIISIVHKILYPPPPELPNAAFGKLPPIVFPKVINNTSYTYKLDTISGEFPVFPDKIKVYKTVSPVVTTLNVDTARHKIAALGFIDTGDDNFSEKELNPTNYVWHYRNFNVDKFINMDTNNYNFTFSSTYLNNLDVINRQNGLNDDKAPQRIVRDTLGAMGELSDDIDFSKTLVRGLVYQDGKIVQTDNTGNAQLIQVDLFHKDIDKMPVFNPMYPFSTMTFIMLASATDQNDLVSGKFYHQSIMSDTYGTYPIKTAKEAFDELQAGKAYITNTFGSGTAIAIDDIELGYYMGITEDENGTIMKYVMPVILFARKNNNNFYALVPAVKDACLTTSSASIDDCTGKNIKKQ